MIGSASRFRTKNVRKPAHRIAQTDLQSLGPGRQAFVRPFVLVRLDERHAVAQAGRIRSQRRRVLVSLRELVELRPVERWHGGGSGRIAA